MRLTPRCAIQQRRNVSRRIRSSSHNNSRNSSKQLHNLHHHRRRRSRILVRSRDKPRITRCTSNCC